MAFARFVRLPPDPLTPSPVAAVGAVALGIALLKEVSGEADIDRAQARAEQCDCAVAQTPTGRKNVFLTSLDDRYRGSTTTFSFDLRTSEALADGAPFATRREGDRRPIGRGCAKRTVCRWSCGDGVHLTQASAPALAQTSAVSPQRR